MRQFKTYVSLILAVFFAIGCPGFGDEEGPITDVPDLPRWSTDVQPLMEKYCNECHSVPSQQLAPGFFRTDECEDDENAILGAKSMSARHAVRTTQVKTMPPSNYGAQPTEIERQIFQRWHDTGAPCMGEGVAPNNMNNTNSENSTNNANSTNNQNGTNNTNNANSTNNQNNVIAAQFQDIVSILTVNCGASNCHGSPSHISGFEVSRTSTPAEVRAAIEDVEVARGSLVIPGNPDGSRLYIAVSTANIDNRMPPAPNLALPDNQIQAIRTWIAAGALYE